MEIVLFYLSSLNLVFRKMENIRWPAGHIASLLIQIFEASESVTRLFYRAENCGRIS